MSDLKKQFEREVNEVLGTLKPFVDIKNAGVTDWYGSDKTKVLVGTPLNHPIDRLNGKIITSSKILHIKGNVVETRNTLYNVLNWINENTTYDA